MQTWAMIWKDISQQKIHSQQVHEKMLKIVSH